MFPILNIPNKMASPLSRLACLAGRIFTNTAKLPPGVDERRQLVELMNNIKLEDIPFDRMHLQPSFRWSVKQGIPPVMYVPLWEDDTFIMSVFILHHGARLPLHDHPGMHGFIKVIHGKAWIQSYTFLEDEEPPARLLSQMRFLASSDDVVLNVKCAKKLKNQMLHPEDPVCCLTPKEANAHEIWAEGGPMAFLDILSPPYDNVHGTRQCNYYRDTRSMSSLIKYPDNWYLLNTQDPPDYWCGTTPYLGEKLDPYGGNDMDVSDDSDL